MILCTTTFIRLSDRVNDPVRDFSLPRLYDLLRGLLLLTAAASLVLAAMIALDTEDLDKDVVVYVAIAVVIGSFLLAFTQLGISDKPD